MGYFSNGTEGMSYEAEYCCKCIHYDDPCAVWGAHLQCNRQEANNEDSILHMLIPQRKKGIGNEQCLMFKKALTAENP